MMHVARGASGAGGAHQGQGSGSLLAKENASLKPRFMKCAISPARHSMTIVAIISSSSCGGNDSTVPPIAFLNKSYLKTSSGLFGFSSERLKLQTTEIVRCMRWGVGFTGER